MITYFRMDVGRLMLEPEESVNHARHTYTCGWDRIQYRVIDLGAYAGNRRGPRDEQTAWSVITSSTVLPTNVVKAQ